MKDYIKISADFQEWQIQEPRLARLFLYCCLKANKGAAVWRGVNIPPNSHVTTTKRIAAECAERVKYVEGAIKTLIDTGKMTVTPVDGWPQYMIVTISPSALNKLVIL